MTKEIIAAALGFLTAPTFIAVIVAGVYLGKFIGSFGLSSGHYWAGFWAAIGVAALIGICGGLVIFVVEFRNL